MDASGSPITPGSPGAGTAGGAGAQAGRSTEASAGQTQRLSGGEVEALQTRPRVQAQAERFEVRDPAAEVTYRVDSQDAARQRAAQLGTTRMLAVDEEGRRTPLQQVGGQWQRGPTMAPRPAPPVEAWAQERDDESPTVKSVRGRKVVPARVDTSQPNTELAASTASSGKLTRSEAAAERVAVAGRLEAALAERYVLRRPVVSVGDVSLGKTEYRFRGDTQRVAFTASTFKLATQSDSPSVARSMVDLAQARGWHGVRISGSEDFRRMVWMEATVRGMRSQGYEPSRADQELVQREREARQTNRIEPARAGQDAYAEKVDRASGAQQQGPNKAPPADAKATFTSAPTTALSAQKASGRGGGGRKAVLAAIEAVLVSRGVNQARRDAVLTAATEQLAARSQRGEAAPRIKVLDPSAPSQRPTPVRAVPDSQRQRDRGQPAMAHGR